MADDGSREQLASIEGALAVGDPAPLIAALLARGDPLSALAASALRNDASGFAPDAMATAVDRLLTLVREQETQLQALQVMVERGL